MMTPNEEMRRSLSEMIGQAKEVIDANGGPISAATLHEALKRVEDEDGVTAIQVYSAAAGLLAALCALVQDQGIHLFDPESGRWFHMKFDEEPPVGIDGAMIDFDGNITGFMKDGVMVDADGVTPQEPVKGCRICGQEDCTDGNCKTRRDMLAAVRNMGKIAPMEPGTLPDVDAKEEEG